MPTRASCPSLARKTSTNPATTASAWRCAAGAAENIGTFLKADAVGIPPGTKNRASTSLGLMFNPAVRDVPSSNGEEGEEDRWELAGLTRREIRSGDQVQSETVYVFKRPRGEKRR